MRSVKSFFEHRMVTYAEQLSYRGLFGFFPFIILVFALLAVLRVDAVFDRLIEAAMGTPPQQIPEPLEPVAEEGRRRFALLRHYHIIVVGLRRNLHPNGGPERCLRNRGDTLAAEAVRLCPGLRSLPRACLYHRQWTHAYRTASGGVARWAGGARRGVDSAVGMAALPSSPHPACGGAVGRLPHRPRHRSIILVRNTRGCLRRDRLDDHFAGVLVLPGQLRKSRSDLRQPRDGRRPACLPLPLGVGGVARGRDQRGRLPHALRTNR